MLFGMVGFLNLNRSVYCQLILVDQLRRLRLVEGKSAAQGWGALWMDAIRSHHELNP